MDNIFTVGTNFNCTLTIINLVAIAVNIWIARYNIGKNRTIYEVIETTSKDEVNQKLKSGEYTVLYADYGVKLIHKTFYVLGKIKN